MISGKPRAPSVMPLLGSWLFPWFCWCDFHLFPAPSPRFVPSWQLPEMEGLEWMGRAPCQQTQRVCAGLIPVGEARLAPCSCQRLIHSVQNTSFCSLPCEHREFSSTSPYRTRREGPGGVGLKRNAGGSGRARLGVGRAPLLAVGGWVRSWGHLCSHPAPNSWEGSSSLGTGHPELHLPQPPTQGCFGQWEQRSALGSWCLLLPSFHNLRNELGLLNSELPVAFGVLYMCMAGVPWVLLAGIPSGLRWVTQFGDKGSGAIHDLWLIFPYLKSSARLMLAQILSNCWSESRGGREGAPRL